MYSYIIKLAHGFVLIPTILAFKRKKIFTSLKKPQKIDQLTKSVKLNPGYLLAGLNLLSVFSIVNRKGDIFHYQKKHPLVNSIDKKYITFYNQDFKNLIFNKKKQKIFEKFSKKLSNGWRIKGIDNQIIDGCFLIPLIFSLNLNKKINILNNKKFSIISNFLYKKKLVKFDGKKFVYSSAGLYLINNIKIIGVTASYRNMLLNYENLLSSNPKKFFKINNNKETHIDRNLNIESSSRQHEKYFNRILKIIEKIFKRKEIPLYIMDVGCGDGLLLKKIYFHLKKNLKKKIIKKIKLIGIDLNKISINTAKNNLPKSKTILIQESIDNPKQIFDFLNSKKILKDQILQVRSFVDHEREIFAEESEFFIKDRFLDINDRDVISIGKKGELFNSKTINQTLNNYYKKWSKFIGKFGIINLEVHKQSLREMKNNLDLNEGVHFDFIQSLSRQNLCKAKTQIYCMVINNLRPKIIETYPINTNFVRIILGYYVKQTSTSREKKKFFNDAVKFLKKSNK